MLLEISIKQDRQNYGKQRRLTLSNRATILNLVRTAHAAQETGWEAQFQLLAILYNPLDYCLRKDFLSAIWLAMFENSVKIL